MTLILIVNAYYCIILFGRYISLSALNMVMYLRYVLNGFVNN